MVFHEFMFSQTNTLLQVSFGNWFLGKSILTGDWARVIPGAPMHVVFPLSSLCLLGILPTINMNQRVQGKCIATPTRTTPFSNVKGAALGGTQTHDTPLTRQFPTELPGP